MQTILAKIIGIIHIKTWRNFIIKKENKDENSNLYMTLDQNIISKTYFTSVLCTKTRTIQNLNALMDTFFQLTRMLRVLFNFDNTSV